MKFSLRIPSCSIGNCRFSLMCFICVKFLRVIKRFVSSTLSHSQMCVQTMHSFVNRKVSFFSCFLLFEHRSSNNIRAWPYQCRIIHILAPRDYSNEAASRDFQNSIKIVRYYYQFFLIIIDVPKNYERRHCLKFCVPFKLASLIPVLATYVNPTILMRSVVHFVNAYKCLS